MRSLTHSKISMVPILRDHWATLVSTEDGQRDRSAMVEQYGGPIVVGILYAWMGDGPMSSAASGALAAATALLMGFMLQLTVSMFDRSAGIADARPEPTPLTKQHAQLVDAVAANASYASLVSLLTTAALTTAALGDGWIGEVGSVTAAALLAHLGLLMLLLLRRVYLLGRRHRIEVVTGAIHDDD